MFKQYEVTDPEEQKLIVRLFKRFYYRSIEKKYGYLKKNITVSSDPPEILGIELYSEMQINPKILSLIGVHIAFQDDAKIRWIDFVRIITVFLFRKPLMEVRYKTLFNLLGLKNDYSVLEFDDYLQDQLQKLIFKKRNSCIVPTGEIQSLWNKVRKLLLRNKRTVF